MEVERRAVEAEFRFAPPADGTRTAGVLSGYAAIFNSLSQVIGTPARRFRERIAPGAFRAALEAVAAGENVFAYYHHGADMGGPAMPLGSTRAQTLRVREDGVGLAFDLDLPDTSDGRDLAELVRRGDVRGVSFGWPAGGARDTWQNEGGMMVRTLHEVRRLIDISPTHAPSYSDTALAVRSLEGWEAEVRALGETEARARRLRRLRLAELA